MADSKITALTSIGTSTDPANDPLVLVDVSDTSMAASGTTKKVTLNNLLACSPTATLASATITGDLTVDTNTLKVDSTNDRVGIGTATPAAKLIVRDGTNRNLLVSSDATQLGSAGIAIGGFTDNAAGYAPMSLLASAMQFGIGGSTAMTLNSAGLGVGVTPSVRLHVSTTSLIAARLESTSASNACLIDLKDASTTATAKVMVGSKGDALQLYSGGNVSATLDANSNVGIGVTPSAWGSNFKSIESGASSAYAIAAANVNGIQIASNCYNDNTNWIYKTTGTAARFSVNANQFQWFNAPSGTAGNAVTFTQAMTLDANGNLILLSSNTPATLTTNGQLTVNATSNTNLRFSYRGSDGVTRVANITLA